MGKTSETKFRILKREDSNACSYCARNIIGLGVDIFTLETLIHEINEIETTALIEEFSNDTYDGITTIVLESGELQFAPFAEVIETKLKTGIFPQVFNTWVSHLISPHGERSLIYPCMTTFRGEITTEEFLEDPKVIDEIIKKGMKEHVRRNKR